MTIQELSDRLDARLDKQDQARDELQTQMIFVKVKLGKVETQIEERSKAAEKEAETAATTAKAAIEANAASCSARHASALKRIGRLEGGFIAVGLAAVVACWDRVWDAVGGKGA